jgi:hypothetical protein
MHGLLGLERPEELHDEGAHHVGQDIFLRLDLLDLSVSNGANAQYPAL